MMVFNFCIKVASERLRGSKEGAKDVDAAVYGPRVNTIFSAFINSNPVSICTLLSRMPWSERVDGSAPLNLVEKKKHSLVHVW